MRRVIAIYLGGCNLRLALSMAAFALDFNGTLGRFTIRAAVLTALPGFALTRRMSAFFILGHEGPPRSWTPLRINCYISDTLWQVESYTFQLTRSDYRSFRMSQKTISVVT